MNLASLLARAQRTLDALHRRRRSHPPGVEAPPAGVCERPTGGRHTYRARDGGVGAGVSAAVIARARVGVWKVQEPRRCGSMWQGAASAVDPTVVCAGHGVARRGTSRRSRSSRSSRTPTRARRRVAKLSKPPHTPGFALARAPHRSNPLQRARGRCGYVGPRACARARTLGDTSGRPASRAWERARSCSPAAVTRVGGAIFRVPPAAIPRA